MLALFNGYIDEAFVDRSDLVKRIDSPSAEAIYSIIIGTVAKLLESGVLSVDEEAFVFVPVNKIVLFPELADRRSHLVHALSIRIADLVRFCHIEGVRRQFLRVYDRNGVAAP